MNKTPLMDKQARVPDWLFGEVEEDDFLSGKVPQDLEDTLEEEE